MVGKNHGEKQQKRRMRVVRKAETRKPVWQRVRPNSHTTKNGTFNEGQLQERDHRRDRQPWK